MRLTFSEDIATNQQFSHMFGSECDGDAHVHDEFQIELALLYAVRSEQQPLAHVTR